MTRVARGACVLALFGLMSPVGAVVARELETVALSDDEIVERILELRRELDALMASLPPELRRQVEDRLGQASRDDATRPVVSEPVADEESAQQPPIHPGTEAAPSETAPATLEAEASEPEPLPPMARASAQPAACADLVEFDSNGDETLSGFDRYWRYFRLWSDDGDGAMGDKELRTFYDAGVGSVSLSLRSYTDLDGGVGDVVVSEHILFDLPRSKRRAAILVIDASRLARGGEVELRSQHGIPLEGLQTLGRQTRIFSAETGERALICP